MKLQCVLVLCLFDGCLPTLQDDLALTEEGDIAAEEPASGEYAPPVLEGEEDEPRVVVYSLVGTGHQPYESSPQWSLVEDRTNEDFRPEELERDGDNHHEDNHKQTYSAQDHEDNYYINERQHNGHDDEYNTNEPHYNGHDDKYNTNEPHYNDHDDKYNIDEPHNNGHDDKYNIDEPHNNGHDDKYTMNEPHDNGHDDIDEPSELEYNQNHLEQEYYGGPLEDHQLYDQGYDHASHQVLQHAYEPEPDYPPALGLQVSIDRSDVAGPVHQDPGFGMPEQYNYELEAFHNQKQWQEENQPTKGWFATALKNFRERGERRVESGYHRLAEFMSHLLYGENNKRSEDGTSISTISTIVAVVSLVISGIFLL